MSSSKWYFVAVWLTPALLLAGACSEKEGGTVPNDWRGVCVDSDLDGFGFQCAAGNDCNDNDSLVHEGCDRCADPNEGCACEDGAEAVSCALPYELTSSGGLLCRTGMRYCRDARWTACEGISSFVVSTPQKLRFKLQGLDGDASTSDASARTCGNACNPDCYRVEDRISPEAGLLSDGGMDGGSSVVGTGNGGISIEYYPGKEPAIRDAGDLATYDCSVGLPPDKDCDRIPDLYDNLEVTDAGGTVTSSFKSIFADLAPGQSVSQQFDLSFKITTADIYFYLDMSGSMAEERDQLIKDLTSGNFLPADVKDKDCSDRNFDGVADNYLKDAGVAGNIACLIRGANFGSGWFRDLPISGVGAVDYEMFENRTDIVSDPAVVKTALQTFITRGGLDLPEGSMQGLFHLATGKEVFAGWDRPGIPKRVDCPSGTWGGACFRDGTIPIIIHISDDALHNGPTVSTGTNTTSSSAYTATMLSDHVGYGTSTTHGTDSIYYRPLTTAADTLDNAQDFGTIDGKLVTYVGDTSKLASNYTYASSGIGTCSSGVGWSATSQTAPDAVFKFKVESTGTSGPRAVRLSGNGTRFNSSLMLLAASTPTPTPASDNGSFGNATNLGTLSGARISLSGNTSNATQHPAVYAREGLSLDNQCFASTTANDLGAAAVHKFRLDRDNLALSFSGSAAQNVALFSSASTPPTTTSLAGINCGSGVVSNCNDKFGNYSAGVLTGKHLHYTAGDTALANVISDYGSYFAGCSSAYGGSGDSVINFSLSAPTKIRLETAGSGTSLATTFAHGLSLVQYGSGPFYSKVNVPDSNGTEATAYAISDAQITATNGDWVRFQGSSESDTATFLQSEVGGSTANVCGTGYTGAASSLRDRVFKFTVGSTANYEFETLPVDPAAGYQTWLSLHKTAVSSSPTSSTRTMSMGSAVQDIGNLEKRRVVMTNGLMRMADRTWDPDLFAGCATGNNNGGRDHVISFTVESATNVTISTVNSAGTAGTLPNFNSTVQLFAGAVELSKALGACGSDQSGYGFTRTYAVSPGITYYAVVKEWAYDNNLSSTEGQFGVILSDTRYPVTAEFLACNAGSQPTNNKYSRITRTLTAGTYYLVVKGTGTTGKHSYALNIRKAPTTSSGVRYVAQTCADSSSGRAVIEDTFAAGDYAVIVKGTGTNEGKYNLTMRDLSVAPKPVACFNSASTASLTTSALPKNDIYGQPIDYYVVTRANSAEGAYSLVIEDATSAATYTNRCDDDGGNGDDGDITANLYPGTYYAILKGASAGAAGQFQMTIGDAASVSAAMVPKTWDADIKSALADKGIKVITVNATGAGLTGGGTTSLSTGYKQTLAMSTATGAPTVSSTQTYEVDGNGVGMGSSIITAVNDLTKKMTMDLFAQLVPVSPIPETPFGFASVAVDVPTGNCTGGISSDKTTHLTCGPGAQPTFRVTITNPLDNPVDPAKGDKNGGYMMALELVGKVNGTGELRLIDRVPVYIIPADVIKEPTTPSMYAPTGTYSENTSATCSGTATPNWRSLYWDALIPNGTSVEWKVCTATSEAALSSCSMVTAATVTSGATCTSNSECAAGNGYCARSGVCEYAVGPTCGTDDAVCGVNGKCVSGSCRWTQNPIDLLPALRGGLQGQSYLRMSVTMNANSALTAAPTINDWDLEYRCVPGV